MLSENIKTIRKAKGLSQEELAVKLNVVRQTISRWRNYRKLMMIMQCKNLCLDISLLDQMEAANYTE